MKKTRKTYNIKQIKINNIVSNIEDINKYNEMIKIITYIQINF
ncbi:MAG: hypothetical protein N4A50_04165 [Vallitalea sp.]|jgi:hypothetical protein|nr:hypothetical protein [Vallitalea sp.]